jgi:dihydrofolate synthase/folylpolyglutamate synthase
VSAPELAAWLTHAERLHPAEIDLTLARSRELLRALALERPPFPAILVGGTNGKGSCVAFLEAMLRAAGLRVGTYTSPHLVRYEERVRVDGVPLDAAAHAAGFAAVEEVRGALAPTFFEFGTAAALWCLRRAQVDVALLEVGLGGRLDAVNAVEPVASAITSIDLDHVALLGPDRERIGAEKAGIMRAGTTTALGDPDPPRSIAAHAAALGATLWSHGRELAIETRVDGWSLATPRAVRSRLPLPALAGEFQLRNAACAIGVLDAVAERLAVPELAIVEGLRRARLPARIARFAGPVEVVLDVAHNPAAARALAAALAAPPRRTHVVIGLLADKDARGILTALAPAAAAWHAVDLDGARGRSAAALAAEIATVAPRASVASHADPRAAFDAARAAATPGDRILVCGSFRVVGGLMASGLYCADPGVLDG